LEWSKRRWQHLILSVEEAEVLQPENMTTQTKQIR